MTFLEIRNLHAHVEGTEILKGFELTINKGEIHAIMGPNGAGKSTLGKVLAGHPSYEVTEGSVLFHGKDLLNLDPEERAHLGLFVSFQYPVEIPGVSNRLFLRTAYNTLRKHRNEKELSEADFDTLLDETMQKLKIKPELKSRNINEGFSGGEKKRNEILQMALFNPTLALLDETDSGLDIDALRAVSDGVNHLMHPEMGLLLITHYQRLLNYISPQFVHVMMDGKIVKSGGAELAQELEKKGYENAKAV